MSFEKLSHFGILSYQAGKELRKLIEEMKLKIKEVEQESESKEMDSSIKKLEALGLTEEELKKIGRKLFAEINLEDRKESVDAYKHQFEAFIQNNTYLQGIIRELKGVIIEERRKYAALEKDYNGLVKELEKYEIEPKVGDMCLFWNINCKTVAYGKLIRIMPEEPKSYVSIDKNIYSYCVKATQDNINETITKLTYE